MITRNRITAFYFLFISVITSFTIQAQEKSSSELYKTIIAKDSLLFTIGFNTCDISQFENLVSSEFKFYHDKGGITPTKADFLISIKKSICNPTNNYKIRRQLIKGTTQVYPLFKDDVLYGAIQMGEHSFYKTEKGKKETEGSTAKFTHVWILENGTWKLSNVLSYDHQEKH
ncbi:nuclear transport factor 2 family protein [Flavobacterium sp. '19STA2R22 D10 B1']|uniref:nuclear transport factor 2 family protein n=1 Tax=Flavobacterium aerium TaxID=3037261 RepID=UPI00278C05C4|nr:nuclear transport factor 2 family protein [Flavobacterium sp. '19STA2R22 D10 B1']